jgi:hypothetical protein
MDKANPEFERTKSTLNMSGDKAYVSMGEDKPNLI